MKLVFAIVQHDDGKKVMDELSKSGFSVTKLCSTGGFLKAGNLTLMMGVEEDKVDEVLAIIEKKSKSRKQGIQVTTPVNDMGGVFIPNEIEVTVGGATIFITDIFRHEKF